jgi:hypothetical protein
MAKVVIDKPKTHAFAQKVTRPLVRRTCNEILLGARRLAPRGTHMSGSGKRKLGQPLQTSLKSAVTMSLDVVEGRVGSSANWAATVHQGSQPHRIYSKKGKTLKFEWERGMAVLTARGRRRKGRSRVHARRFFFFAQVTHPGNKRPIRYLTTPMHQFGRANGFRTTSLPVTRSRLP